MKFPLLSPDPKRLWSPNPGWVELFILCLLRGVYFIGTIVHIHMLLFHSCFIIQCGYLPLHVRSSWRVLPPRQEHVTSPLAERRHRSWQPPLFTLHRDSSPKWKKTRVRRTKPIQKWGWRYRLELSKSDNKKLVDRTFNGVFGYFCLKTTSTNTWTTQSIFKTESNFFFLGKAES